MSIELIYYRKDTVTETGKMPWQAPERDNWYAYSAEAPDGKSMGRAKRTAHAAAIGRAILADKRARGQNITAVRVYAYDTDEDTQPAITADGKELVEVENHMALAVVTDTIPVGEAVAQLERDVETARMVQRQYEAAKAKVAESMQEVFSESYHRDDPSDPDHRSANGLAAMVKGLFSRPTVLKMLRVRESEADC